MTWNGFWRGVDRARVVPRIALMFYGWMAYSLHEWFMLQKDISTPQTIYVSTVWAAFPVLLKFYMENGVKWEPPKDSSQSG